MIKNLSIPLYCMFWLLPTVSNCQAVSNDRQNAASVHYKEKDKKTIRILPLGESTTDGGNFFSYRKALSDSLRTNNIAFDFIGSLKGPGVGWDTDHQGMSGKACKDLSEWIAANSSVYIADIILLWQGTNDCGWAWQYYGTPESSLSKLIDTICFYQPHAELFVATIPTLGDNAYTPTNARGGANANAVAYNNAMQAIITEKRAQGKKINFVDTRGVILLSDLIDGIHPTQEGYDKMAPFWFKAMQPLVMKNDASY